MKVALALLLLVAVGFTLAMFAPAVRDPAPGGIPERCKDDPRTCSPFAGRLDELTGLWAARLVLPDWQLADGATREAAVARGGDGLRVARMRLDTGSAALVRYHCQELDDADECPQAIALCTAGTVLDAAGMQDVDRRWRQARQAAGNRLRCRAGDEAGRLVVYPQGGRLEATAPLGRARIVFE